MGLKSCSPLSRFTGCKRLFQIRTDFSSLEVIINYENNMGPILTFHMLSLTLIICGLNGKGTRGFLSLKYAMLVSSLLNFLSVY